MKSEVHRIHYCIDPRQTLGQHHASYESECFLGLSEAFLQGSSDGLES